MSDEKPVDASKRFEKALQDQKNAAYVLRLYVAGNTSKSIEAIENIRSVCEHKLKGRYTLEVIDIHQQPGLAREAQIIATPTLIKQLPLPLRRIIGDLSAQERIFIGLDLESIGIDAPDDPAEHDGK